MIFGVFFLVATMFYIMSGMADGVLKKFTVSTSVAIGYILLVFLTTFVTDIKIFDLARFNLGYGIMVLICVIMFISLKDTSVMGNLLVLLFVIGFNVVLLGLIMNYLKLSAYIDINFTMCFFCILLSILFFETSKEATISACLSYFLSTLVITALTQDWEFIFFEIGYESDFASLSLCFIGTSLIFHVIKNYKAVNVNLMVDSSGEK